jgi:hypothetical protein
MDTMTGRGGRTCALPIAWFSARLSIKTRHGNQQADLATHSEEREEDDKDL